MATAVWKEPKPASRALQYLALVGYLVFLGFPLVWMLSIALKGPQEIGTAETFFPRDPTLGNFTTRSSGPTCCCRRATACWSRSRPRCS